MKKCLKLRGRLELKKIEERERKREIGRVSAEKGERTEFLGIKLILVKMKTKSTILALYTILGMSKIIGEMKGKIIRHGVLVYTSILLEFLPRQVSGVSLTLSPTKIFYNLLKEVFLPNSNP